MDEQRQLELIYNSSVPIQDIAMDRDGWQERVREIRAGSAT